MRCRHATSPAFRHSVPPLRAARHQGGARAVRRWRCARRSPPDAARCRAPPRFLDRPAVDKNVLQKSELPTLHGERTPPRLYFAFMERKKFLRRLPRPDAPRKFPRAFGWVDVELLRSGWLSRLTPEDALVYLFLCLAADRDGVSFYRVDRIARLVAVDERTIINARHRLCEFGLVAFEPFAPGRLDGFWQVLPVPPCSKEIFPWM